MVTQRENSPGNKPSEPTLCSSTIASKQQKPSPKISVARILPTVQGTDQPVEWTRDVKLTPTLPFCDIAHLKQAITIQLDLHLAGFVILKVEPVHDSSFRM